MNPSQELRKIKILGKNVSDFVLKDKIYYPWELLDLMLDEFKNIQTDVKGVVEKGAVIKGKLILGVNSLVKSGVYIEGDVYIGKNCVIGPNCYIRGQSSIGDDSVVGGAVEVTRSIIGSNTKIKHLSYIGDSVIGNNVNIAAGTIIANLRHNRAEILYMCDGKKINTKRRKFGAFIESGVKTGVNTIVYPGSRIQKDSITFPGEIVK